MATRETLRKAADSKWGPWIGVLVALLGVISVYYEYRTADAEAEAAKFKATLLEKMAREAENETGKQFEDHQKAIEAVYLKSSFEDKKVQMSIDKAELERKLLEREIEKLWQRVMELDAVCVRRNTPRRGGGGGGGGGGGIGTDPLVTVVSDEPDDEVTLSEPKKKVIREKVDEARGTLKFRTYEQKFLQQTIREPVTAD